MSVDNGLLLLTLALVVVTAYYAWQTYRMVEEMKAARGASLLPKLIPSMTYIGAKNAFPRITNAGPGPAIEVDVTLSYAPGNGLATRWHNPVLVSGESHEFIPRIGTAIAEIDELIGKYAEMRLDGTCRDALGVVHQIHEAVSIRDWWESAKAAHERVPHDYIKESRDQLERIARALEKP